MYTNLVQIFNHFLIESRYGLLDAKIEFLCLFLRLGLQRQKNIDLFSKKIFILGQSYVVDTIWVDSGLFSYTNTVLTDSGLSSSNIA